jgi:hypothetical protein
MLERDPLPSGLGGTDTGVLDFCGGFLVVAMIVQPFGLNKTVIGHFGMGIGCPGFRA